MPRAQLPTVAEVRAQLLAHEHTLCALQAASIKYRAYRVTDMRAMTALWREALALALVTPHVEVQGLLDLMVHHCRPGKDADREHLRDVGRRLVFMWEAVRREGVSGDQLPPWCASLPLMVHQVAKLEPWTDEARALLEELVRLRGIVLSGVVASPMAVDILNFSPWGY